MLESKDEGYHGRRSLIFHDENTIQDISYKHHQQRCGKTDHPEFNYYTCVAAYGQLPLRTSIYNPGRDL